MNKSQATNSSPGSIQEERDLRIDAHYDAGELSSHEVADEEAFEAENTFDTFLSSSDQEVDSSEDDAVEKSCVSTHDFKDNDINCDLLHHSENEEDSDFEFPELNGGLYIEFAELDDEIHIEFAELDDEIHMEFAELDDDSHIEFAELDYDSHIEFGLQMIVNLILRIWLFFIGRHPYGDSSVQDEEKEEVADVDSERSATDVSDSVMVYKSSEIDFDAVEGYGGATDSVIQKEKKSHSDVDPAERSDEENFDNDLAEFAGYNRFSDLVILDEEPWDLNIHDSISEDEEDKKDEPSLM